MNLIGTIFELYQDILIVIYDRKQNLLNRKNINIVKILYFNCITKTQSFFRKCREFGTII